MKKIFLIAFLATAIGFAQNPFPAPRGIDTKFVQLDTLSVTDRDNMVVPDAKTRVVSVNDTLYYYHKGTASWKQIGGSGVISNIYTADGQLGADEDRFFDLGTGGSEFYVRSNDLSSYLNISNTDFLFYNRNGDIQFRPGNGASFDPIAVGDVPIATNTLGGWRWGTFDLSNYATLNGNNTFTGTNDFLSTLTAGDGTTSNQFFIRSLHDNPFQMFEGATLRTTLTRHGTQVWYIKDLLDNEIGSVSYNSNDGYTGINIYSYPATNANRFELTNMITRLRIKPWDVADGGGINILKSNGHVGINKSNPTTELDVNGNVAVSGNITASPSTAPNEVVVQSQLEAPITDKTVSDGYTFIAGDQNYLILYDSASDGTLNVPTNASVPYDIGTIITVEAINTGNVTIDFSAVTGTNTTTYAGDKVISFKKTATDTWRIINQNDPLVVQSDLDDVLVDSDLTEFQYINSPTHWLINYGLNISNPDDTGSDNVFDVFNRSDSSGNATSNIAVAIHQYRPGSKGLQIDATNSGTLLGLTNSRNTNFGTQYGSSNFISCKNINLPNINANWSNEPFLINQFGYHIYKNYSIHQLDWDDTAVTTSGYQINTNLTWQDSSLLFMVRNNNVTRMSVNGAGQVQASDATFNSHLSTWGQTKNYADNLLQEYTVATLPASPSGSQRMAIVTDASSVSYRGNATGGGSTVALVFYDGTNWIYH